MKELSEARDDEQRVVDADADPIIETRIGVTVLISVCPARMNSNRKAVINAMIASATGIIIATNVRNTSNSTMIAASRPSTRRSLLDRREFCLAVVLHRHPGRLHGLTHGVLDRDDRVRSLSSIVWSNCASA